MFRPLVVLALLSTTASADPELRLSVGAGAAAAYHDPCGYMAEPDCMGERTRVSGAAPLVLAGVRGTFDLTTNWRYRLGATASALLIATEERSTVMTGAGEVGLARGRYAFDMIMGISRLKLAGETGATFMTGFAFSGRISKTLAAFGRIDLHAMMHSPIGGAFAGAGLEWTPAY